MNISDFTDNDFIVINKNKDIENGDICSVDEFFERAQSADGLNIDGDLYCRISDFSFENYQIVKEAIDEVKWFDFSKNDVPSWFKVDTAIIIDIPENKSNISSITEDEVQRNMELEIERIEKEKIKEKIKEKEIIPETEEDIEDYGQSHQESIMRGVKSLFDSSKEDIKEEGEKEAIVYVFGSSKGGTGKTFTSLISGYRYAKNNPGKRVAIVDFDIIDGQVGISIQEVQPTMLSYWRSWVNGDRSFQTMRSFCTKSENFPNNIDFYLAPRDYYINDKEFWIDIISNLTSNYDTVFFDTGIDYINYPPISFVYKIADRVVLVSTTSIKSVSSVLKQISKLKGTSSSTDANGNEVFSREDNIGPKLRLAITGCDPKDSMNNMVLDTFHKNIKINAVFGQLSSTIGEAEYYGKWGIFDNNRKFNEALDKLVDLDQ